MNLLSWYQAGRFHDRTLPPTPNAASAAMANDVAVAERAAAAAAEREAAVAHEREDAVARERAADATLEHDAAAAREHQAAHASQVQQVLILYEAAALSNLHAQAVAVQNIKALVPIVLDLSSPHYSKWREHLLLTLGKYSLTDHVLTDDTHPELPDWYRMDCVVRSWLYGMISTELVEILMEPNTTALTRDLPVSDYCRKLKSMADALGALGEPVQDQTLVLTVLRDLNDKFTYMAALLKRQRPFPSFLEVRSDLLLEELTMENRPSSVTAFITTNPSAPRGGTQTEGAPSGSIGDTSGTRPPGPPHAGAPQGHPSSGSDNSNRCRCCGNGGAKASGSAGSSNTNTVPWPSFYNPWTGTI
ncbi:uncharacterized protein LOC133888376 [Phragmites australis]|uniref:uncharacterized protein LOC133888376 n=1 Tax=Phragmites australis TaxID=29695 RepID=UPI002D787628|nr:uncharacterized protein LOC133888376 [Phragmites australis]